jgi:excisionase family DNA binding protein
MNGILTVPEVATTLNVTQEYVRRLLRNKRLTGFKLGDVWRVKSEDLDAFISKKIKTTRGTVVSTRAGGAAGAGASDKKATGTDSRSAGPSSDEAER